MNTKKTQCCDEGACSNNSEYLDPMVLIGSAGWLGSLIRKPELVIPYRPQKSLEERMTRIAGPGMNMSKEAKAYMIRLIHMLSIRETNLNMIVYHHRRTKKHDLLLEKLYGDQDDSNDSEPEVQFLEDNIHKELPVTALQTDESAQSSCQTSNSKANNETR